MKLRRRVLPGLAVLILAALLGLIAGLIASGGRQVSQASAARSGRVLDILPSPTGAVLTVRTKGSRLTMLPAKKVVRLTSRDGHRMSDSDIRVGDEITVGAKGQIQDTSQAMTVMHGVVAVSAMDATGPIIVAVGPSRSIVVDLNGGVQYGDASHQTSSPAQIDDGDEVRLTGIYNAAFGEMTHTVAILRTGPDRRPGAGPSH